ncbi:HPr family phosphocarrier protein [Corynebacterium kroppenstedtii]|uniref:HPr family phosphocarrier protein n=1 Tax=Corynebacterium kroppenstedtii TaxID=161879 RepID=UPI0026555C86|nr:HPr family phosphocarrier protein [Corynebacterium kroppenstedtii]MDN8623591.1 HPr family phosphocarrier protein [Corynebacterium kroppenstedtii]
MASTTVTVGSTVGLHARPAAVIAEEASNYDDEILISLPDDDDAEPADAASSLMIMALGAAHGDTVEVSSENAEAVEKIAALVSQNLDNE